MSITEVEGIASQIWAVVMSMGMSVIWALVVIFVGLKLIKVVRNAVRKVMEKSHIDTGVIQFLDAFVKIACYALLAIIVLANFGVQTTSFITIIGTLGVTVGLALQGSLSNLAGGILILVLKPFKVGDFITGSGAEGIVKEISLFCTTITTPDNKDMIIPNSTLSNGMITNYSANENRRIDMKVGVSYSSDFKRAKELICSVLDADERVLKDPAYTVAVDEMEDSSVTILIRPWVHNADYWAAKWDLTEQVCNTLQSNGIEIPFTQVVVHNAKDEE